MNSENDRSGDRPTRRQLLGATGSVLLSSAAGCLDDDSDAISFPLSVRLEVDADNTDRIAWTAAIAQVMEQTGYFDVEIEEYELDDFLERIFQPKYAAKGNVPFLSISGTFNPESYCDPLHGTENQGQCCNLNGLGYDELDAMIDQARFGTEVVDNPALRARRYDEIWHELAEFRGSSVITYITEEYVRNTDVRGFSPYPFVEGTLDYALYSPSDRVLTWIDRDAAGATGDEWSAHRTGGTLRYGMDANIESFDPPYSTDIYSTSAQSLLFEGLTTLDAEGNVFPWLAKGYELVDVQDIDRRAYEPYMRPVPTDDEGVLEFDGDGDVQAIVVHPDDDRIADDEVSVLTPADAAEAVEAGVYGMQYRYELHEGVTFHNGEELTADHVVATAKRYENSDVAAQTFDSVLHVEAVDEYVVDIYAQVPDAEAERELPTFRIHTLEQAELPPNGIDPLQDTPPIGTGPYEFETFEDERYFRARKTDDYWLERKGIDALEWYDGPESFPAGPVVDAVDVEIISGDSTRSVALQNDEIDLTFGLVSSTLEAYEDDDGYVVDSIQGGGYQFFQYPVTVEPWDDARLRRAVNHLVPRKRIVEELLDGWGEPAWTMLPKIARETGTADYEALEADLREKNAFDTEAAIELIETVIDDRGYDSNVQ
ncbi:peptide/nickel transport system substrate-binding protein [Halostagnicola kamekurae]|uniref:Peptide/nickel transport system substrate-binding protein n=2 Tax=Halostagnicola kamekurae TaxID=619731 RepID=A0A1I6RYW6_9EURY|nr:ABC transporter substrate-binding protein [Halostagnicola kamekurae]SFS69899.1 peptide/nickel transport system substrate-binding protein [Halostagnicola kamekurae]